MRFEIVAVSKRLLCPDEFLERVEALAEVKAALILREKDLAPDAYEALARKVSELYAKHGAPLIVHGFPDVVGRVRCAGFHAPFSLLKQRPGLCRELHPLPVGVSVHSVKEALFAAASGAARVVVGNIFETASKKGVAGRGVEFLAEVCWRVPIPVYAIGGISERNIFAVRDAGAAGACMMSYFMS
ncbi:MAG: thiamine phosphate synthase [Candidatus Accumulibacter sp.]|nr:thiamine phosphate synthase [Accumulibacter sp.]